MLWPMISNAEDILDSSTDSEQIGRCPLVDSTFRRGRFQHIPFFFGVCACVPSSSSPASDVT